MLSKEGPIAAKISEKIKKIQQAHDKVEQVPNLIASELWRSPLNSSQNPGCAQPFQGQVDAKAPDSWAVLETQNCPTIHSELLPRTQTARFSSSSCVNKTKKQIKVS